MCEQKPYLATILLALLACVASVFNRVIARKVERELKTNRGGKGRGEKETFSPLSSPVIPFFRVRTGHGKPGKSWNLRISFSMPGKSWNLVFGPGKSWEIKATCLVD